MATGDLKNNLRILNTKLKKLNLPSNQCNIAGVSSGNPDAFLDVFDNVLQWHNPALSRLINSKGLKPPSMQENKMKFLEGVYLIFREIFSWKPPLTASQFLSNGFHEKKVIMCTEFIRLVTQKIHELEPKAAKKQLMETGHSGLKLILKQPKKVILPLKEKDMNLKPTSQTCGEKCSFLKGESCICQCKQFVEKSSSESVALSDGNHVMSDCWENRNAKDIIDGSLLTELLEFKTVVLNKLESIEFRLSATEQKINILENMVYDLKGANSTTKPIPVKS